VFRSIVAVLFVALFVNMALASDARTLTARSGVQPAHSQEAVHPFVNVAAVIQSQTTLIFVSDSENNVVNIYNKVGGALVGQLAGFNEPQGIAVDNQGNLYVANTSGNNILVYAPPYTALTATYDDLGQFPAGVSAFGNGKFVAVTNILGAGFGPGSITVFKSGVAVATITDPSIAEAFFCGFDLDGNLYFDYFDASFTAQIGEIAAATRKGTTFTPLTSGVALEFPGGVEVGKKNIAVDDQDAKVIYTFAPPVGSSLGSPIFTTPLSGSGDAVTFYFGPTFKDVWVADAENADAADYLYPAGGSPTSTIAIPSSEPIGVAVYRTR
jgi:hypothetical protein